MRWNDKVLMTNDNLMKAEKAPADIIKILIGLFGLVFTGGVLDLMNFTNLTNSTIRFIFL